MTRCAGSVPVNAHRTPSCPACARAARASLATNHVREAFVTVTFNSGPSSTSAHAGRPDRKPRTRPAGGDMLRDDAVELVATKPFAELGLPEPLLRARSEAGINSPFPIQSATIPDALAGRDVLGRAQTGSGRPSSAKVLVATSSTASSRSLSP